MFFSCYKSFKKISYKRSKWRESGWKKRDSGLPAKKVVTFDNNEAIKNFKEDPAKKILF